MALTNINDVDGRFISIANRFWWAHVIGFEYQIDPMQVKKWHADDIMETLAAIGLRNKRKKRPPNK